MDTTFSLSEEAFLLRSLKEVVLVWTRGSGQASFNLTVEDGRANLQLGFQLGSPSDSHLAQIRLCIILTINHGPQQEQDPAVDVAAPATLQNSVRFVSIIKLCLPILPVF